MPDQSDAYAAPQGDAPDFVYTIYIAADAETVWNGLIDKELTEKYWGRHNVSDWQVGANWEHGRTDGSGIVDVAGNELANDVLEVWRVDTSAPVAITASWQELKIGTSCSDRVPPLPGTTPATICVPYSRQCFVWN